MVNLFGYQIKRSEEENEKQLPSVESFAPRMEDDGATVVMASGGAYGTYLDLEGSARTEAELISRYRDVAQQPEVEEAIASIVEEAMDTDDDEVVSINLDKLEYPKKVKDRIYEEFEIIKNLLNFDNLAHDIFTKWYIDGRIRYHAIIDEAKPEEGIKELRYIDSRKIRKIREMRPVRKGQVVLEVPKREYYIYNERGFGVALRPGSPNLGSASGIRIAKDSIVECTSGLMDTTNTNVISYLHQAIRPLNILRYVEDATVIYTLARAPERRIFYVDVGGLNKPAAEQYMRDMMTRHKNKLVYDQTTGQIRDDRRILTMLEDYWFPRREGKATEVTTLPGGGTLIALENIEYFQRKLYRALKVPITRLQSETTFNLGRSSEITRDEVKFGKFIGRLRKRFSLLFLGCLEKQLILKKVIAPEEWETLKSRIQFDFAVDNFFSELKHADILTSRMDTLQRMEPYVGKYFSHKWIRKNILMQSDQDIQEMDKEIEEERTKEPAPQDGDQNDDSFQQNRFN